jgi:hypothetical protein
MLDTSRLICQQPIIDFGCLVDGQSAYCFRAAYSCLFRCDRPRCFRQTRSIDEKVGYITVNNDSLDKLTERSPLPRYPTRRYFVRDRPRSLWRSSQSLNPFGCAACLQTLRSNHPRYLALRGIARDSLIFKPNSHTAEVSQRL